MERCGIDDRVVPAPALSRTKSGDNRRKKQKPTERAYGRTRAARAAAVAVWALVVFTGCQLVAGNGNKGDIYARPT